MTSWPTAKNSLKRYHLVCVLYLVFQNKSPQQRPKQKHKILYPVKTQNQTTSTLARNECSPGQAVPPGDLSKGKGGRKAAEAGTLLPRGLQTLFTSCRKHKCTQTLDIKVPLMRQLQRTTDHGSQSSSSSWGSSYKALIEAKILLYRSKRTFSLPFSSLDDQGGIWRHRIIYWASHSVRHGERFFWYRDIGANQGHRHGFLIYRKAKQWVP